jgi:hypothetical protein
LIREIREIRGSEFPSPDITLLLAFVPWPVPEAGTKAANASHL